MVASTHAGIATQLDTRPFPRELPAGTPAGRTGMDGVEAQVTAERDRGAEYIYGARAARDFADGFVAVLLPVYLAAIGLGPLEIGLVATLALLASAAMTLGIGLLAARLCQRTLLMVASALMVATGLAFALSGAYAVVVLAALLGTLNPSSGNVSIFVPIEHAVLARATPAVDRTRTFARYGLIGAFAAAAGALATGSPDLLVAVGVPRLGALKAMFVLYAALGLLGGLLYAQIPRRALCSSLEGCLDQSEGRPQRQSRANPLRPIPLLRAAALGPSRSIVCKLAALFGIDAFAGGFLVQSLLALWLFNKFGLTLVSAGLFFFWSGVLAALSFPVAAWLARRIGLVNTMAFTQLPSNIALVLAAVAPSLELALVLLLARAALSQMDVPTRSSYVMALVTPRERPAAASITSLSRSLAAAASPVLAGALFAAGFEAWPLVICGVLKTVYDIALLWAFRHIKPPEEQ